MKISIENGSFVRGLSCVRARTILFFEHWWGHRWPSTRVKEGLSLENSEKKTKKSLKRGRWGREAPGQQKLDKESKITISQVFLVFSAHFRLSFDFLFELIDPGAERPQQPLLRLFFRSFLGEASLTPVDGQRYLKGAQSMKCTL